MDKRLLQSMGVNFGMPRWKAYLLLLSVSGIGAIFAYGLVVLTLGIFG